MPRKTIIIFISAFVLVGLLVYFLFFFGTSGTNTTGGNLPLYQKFNPFNNGGTSTSSGAITDTSVGGPVSDTSVVGQTVVNNSKFHQLTNFAVAGATFFVDTRPIQQQPQPTDTTQATVSTAVTAPAPQAPIPTSVATNKLPPVSTIKTIKAKAAPVVNTTPKPPVQIVASVPSLRYVDQISGHIIERYLDTGAVGEVSNSTIPGIHEALFDSRASTVIYRYLSSDESTISSFMATLGGAQGEFLPSNILDVSLSPDKTKFFYLTQTPSGVNGTIRAFGDIKKNQVFTSSFTEWLSQWAGNQNIYLTTKASYGVDGDLFLLNTTNGTLSKILGPVQGLTTLANNAGTVVLYSSATTNGPQLSTLTVAGHTISNYSLYTLPEKCVWSHDDITIYCAVPDKIDGQQYPDMWYQGLTSFTDTFVKINTNSLQTTVIADSGNETAIDGTHLFLDDTDSELFFINKKDSTLWSLDLK